MALEGKGSALAEGTVALAVETRIRLLGKGRETRTKYWADDWSDRIRERVHSLSRNVGHEQIFPSKKLIAIEQGTYFCEMSECDLVLQLR